MNHPRSALFQELAVVGKAFGSAKRLELVDLLAQGERTVESLARAADLGLSTTSAHLQVLKLSNLVQTRREGTRIHYRLAGDDVAALYDAMLTVARTRSADVERALDSYLNLPGSGEVGLVTRQELDAILEEAGAAVLDVRPREEYLAGHIPGARSLPFDQLATAVEELRDGPPVIAYCRGAYCVLAHDAVRLLEAAGIEARRLEDGMLEWRTHGHPVEVGA
jgi:rhodanese-related sulfurtransferase